MNKRGLDLDLKKLAEYGLILLFLVLLFGGLYFANHGGLVSKLASLGDKIGGIFRGGAATAIG